MGWPEKIRHWAGRTVYKYVPGRWETILQMIHTDKATAPDGYGTDPQQKSCHVGAKQIQAVVAIPQPKASRTGTSNQISTVTASQE